MPRVRGPGGEVDKFDRLLRIFDPVEINMPERRLEILIGLHDRKCRAADIAAETETLKKSSRKRGFPRPQIAEQSDDVAGAQLSREGPAQAFSAFCRRKEH